jgi:hypothetical protein
MTLSQKMKMDSDGYNYKMSKKKNKCSEKGDGM